MVNPANTIEVMTYNVNFSRRAKGEYAKYSWENRSQDIYKLIKGVNPTILFLQEVLIANTQEVKTLLSDYEWHFEPINSRDGVCQNATGIKTTFLPNQGQLKFGYNFNKIEVGSENVLGVIVNNFLLLNVHFPMAKQSRMSMASNFNKCIPSFIDYKTIIAGDFNSFPDDDGDVQLKFFKEATGTVAVSDSAISESTNEIALKSFKAYPYDPVPVDPLNRTGKLDHIFVKGLSLAENMKPIVLDARSVEGDNFTPSDHFPLIATLTY